MAVLLPGCPSSNLSPTSKTTTFICPAAIAHLSIPDALPLTDENTRGFPLAKLKGNVRGYKSRQKGNMLINKTRANRKVAHVVCSLRTERGCAEFKTLGFASPHAFFFSWIPLSLCQDNSCVSCSWADTGNQILCVSINYTSQEITHLELKHYHKLLGISDCYRCHYRTPVAKIKVSKFCLWRRGFRFRHQR